MCEIATSLSVPKPVCLPVLPSEGGVEFAVFTRLFFALLPARVIWAIDNFEEVNDLSAVAR
ncbi:MAG: hypothetical protein ABI633_05695 [Burkholderiales bacterium]